LGSGRHASPITAEKWVFVRQGSRENRLQAIKLVDFKNLNPLGPQTNQERIEIRHFYVEGVGSRPGANHEKVLWDGDVSLGPDDK
jgi:hypothetical protein